MILDQGVASTTIDAQIAWVIRHRNVSRWLKQALQAALDTDPVNAANDAAMLTTLLRARADAWVDTQLGGASSATSNQQPKTESTFFGTPIDPQASSSRQ